MFELRRLTDDELVAALTNTERVIAAANAEQILVIAELYRRAPEWLTSPEPDRPGLHPVEVTAAEVGPALRISRLSATNRVELALSVTSRLPATLAALGDGTISLTKVRQIDDATAVLTDESAAAVEARVLPRAGGQTPAGLGASLARAVIACDPSAAEARRQQAVRQRRVDVFPAPDGMATLRALLPADQAMSAYSCLSRVAELAVTPGDSRTVDARRADTLVDILRHLGGTGTASAADTTLGAGAVGARNDMSESADPNGSSSDVASTQDGRSGSRRQPKWGSRPVTVHVTVAMTTLAGLDQQPGHLAGYGPITAEAARELASDATWRRLVTDPLTGTVLDVGRTTYSPPVGLADHIRTRDGTCRFPGCRRSATHADIDHTDPYPDGRTAAENLAVLCRSHHRLKTFTRWMLRQEGAGSLTWTSPVGRSYTTHPWPFADPEPGPDWGPRCDPRTGSDKEPRCDPRPPSDKEPRCDTAPRCDCEPERNRGPGSDEGRGSCSGACVPSSSALASTRGTDTGAIGREPDWPEMSDAEYDSQFRWQLMQEAAWGSAVDPAAEGEAAA